MTNLINTYIELFSSGDDALLAGALKKMNEALGTSTSHSRIREWGRGERKPSQAAIDYMLSQVLPYLLAKEGLSVERIDALVKKCLLPERNG